jgi:putative RNA 2'-phosphotransferase
MAIDQVQLSKFLSFVLQHKPDDIGLVLDVEGWANIDELVEKLTPPERISVDMTC